MDADDARFRRIVAIIRERAPVSPLKIETEHRLAEDFLLSGIDLLRIAELIEEEFSITFEMAELLDLALQTPTVGGLHQLVMEALADA